MNKNILAFAFLALLISGCSVKQQIVVRHESSNKNKAIVDLYENGILTATYSAVVGRNGIAQYGEKREGDGKTPAGNYRISAIFGKNEPKNLKMPFIKTEPNLYCIDDSKSKQYNRIVDSKKIEKDFDSFEYMFRSDEQYDLGAVIGYNESSEANKGSCIFMHIQKDDGSPTAGCIAMKEEELNSLLHRLDISKNPHIEIKP